MPTCLFASVSFLYSQRRSGGAFFTDDWREKNKTAFVKRVDRCLQNSCAKIQDISPQDGYHAPGQPRFRSALRFLDVIFEHGADHVPCSKCKLLPFFMFRSCPRDMTDTTIRKNTKATTTCLKSNKKIGSRLSTNVHMRTTTR